MRDNILFYIDEEYVQQRAIEILGNKLNSEEIETIKEKLEWSLSAAAIAIIDELIVETLDKHINNVEKTIDKELNNN